MADHHGICKAEHLTSPVELVLTVTVTVTAVLLERQKASTQVSQLAQWKAFGWFWVGLEQGITLCSEWFRIQGPTH